MASISLPQSTSLDADLTDDFESHAGHVGDHVTHRGDEQERDAGDDQYASDRNSYNTSDKFKHEFKHF